MNKLTILIVATVALCISAWVASQRAQQQYGLDQATLLLPELADQLSQVDRIDIHAAAHAPVSLVEQDGQWQVVQKDHYPADIQQARSALQQLAEAQILEAKTSQAAHYGQLGVQDVDLAQDTTVHLVVTAGDSTVADVVIGKPGMGGSYIRNADDSQTWLIDQQLSLPANASDYLDKSLLSLVREDVQSVAVTPLKGEAYRISKADDDEGDFQLAPAVPQDRKINPANVNRLAAAAANLRISDVLTTTPEGLQWSQAQLRSFDGLQLQLELAKGDGNTRYLTVQADSLPDEEGEIDEDVVEQATRINARSKGRIFVVAQYSADALAMTHAMLLKPEAVEPLD